MISYQSAYLKAHYPAEFMAAVLSRNMTDIKEITNFIEECKRMSINVLRPDVNESDLQFMVNRKGEIRFGMAGIKNVGESAALSIIEERIKNGPYPDLTDFIKRIDLRSVNKRALESLAKAGALECFEGTHRAQYFFKQPGDEDIFLEKLIRYANDVQSKANATQHSLFGMEEEIMLPTITLPKCEPWSKLEQLKHEKEITGFYISGHPLNSYQPEIETYTNISIGGILAEMKNLKGKEFSFAGIVSDASHKVGKSGKPFGSFTVEDYYDSIQLMLFSEDYLKNRHFLLPGTYLMIKARVESRFDSPDQLNVRVNSMMLLTELFERFAKVVTLTLGLSTLTPAISKTIGEIAGKFKGNCPLKIQIVDEEEKSTVEIPAKKFRVNVKEFIVAMEQFEEIRVKVG